MTTRAIGTCCLLLLTSVSCDFIAGPDSAPKPWSLHVEQTGVTIDAGESTQLIAVILDNAGDPVEDVPVTWNSSDSTIVSVDATGMVSGRATGTAQVSISYQDSDTQLDAAVDVEVLGIYSLSFDPSVRIGFDHAPFALVGHPYGTVIAYRVRDREGKPVEGVTVNFQTVSGGGTLSRPSGVTGVEGYATVSLTSGLLPGRNDVLATSPLSRDSAMFSVEGVYGPKLEFGASTIEILPGCTTYVLGKLFYPNGFEWTGRAFDFVTTDTSVVRLYSSTAGSGTYRAQGTNIEARNVGSSLVIGSWQGTDTPLVADTVSVTVVAQKPVELTLWQNWAIALGAHRDLRFSLVDSCRSSIATPKLTAASLDPEIATVEGIVNITDNIEAVRVLGRSRGSARIVAQAGTFADTAVVTVIP